MLAKLHTLSGLLSYLHLLQLLNKLLICIALRILNSEGLLVNMCVILLIIFQNSSYNKTQYKVTIKLTMILEQEVLQLKHVELRLMLLLTTC